jgi:hypothetical protein
MKDLKERILEIIRGNSATGIFAKGERALMLTEPMYEHLASKIESLIKEKYVEKEFVRWLYYEAEYKPELHDLSLADLKRFWLENIKDK